MGRRLGEFGREGVCGPPAPIALHIAGLRVLRTQWRGRGGRGEQAHTQKKGAPPSRTFQALQQRLPLGARLHGAEHELREVQHGLQRALGGRRGAGVTGGALGGLQAPPPIAVAFDGADAPDPRT